MNILVINAGSSSLKYQLMDPETGAVTAKGLCERIGLDGRLTHKVPSQDKKVEREIPMPTHAEAIAAVLEILVDPENGVIAATDEIDAVGHRVLHGGDKFIASCIINEACKQAIRDCIPLGPLHNPANLMGIEACEKVMPGKPQVAVFDTAFHMTMPPQAYRYAIPTEYYETDHLRRYGFHGTSHRYVTRRAIALMGNGSSLSAVKDGKCQDTSMGLSPLAGVPMGTRSGDIDACVVQFIMNKYGMDIDAMLGVLNKKSGVLGISGVSSDFRDLGDGADKGNEDCKLALEKFAYEVAKYVGAYAAALNGIDVLTFTAGVGENDGLVRGMVCDYLGFMGVKLDPELNKSRGKEMVISILNDVGLDKQYLNRFPHEFSGGQRQRIGIARALILNPEFVVCDEAVSALDVSVRAQVLNLMKKMQQKRNLTYLFISHDLSVVRHVSDRVAVMYLGSVVEIADKQDLYGAPLHPYTRALLSAIPIPDANRKRNRIILEGDIPSPANPPEGCRFRTRCRYATELCKTPPPLRGTGDPKDGHLVACHYNSPDFSKRWEDRR